jgi:hypothetical protein
LAGFDSVHQADDERWAGYIEEWALRAELDSWLASSYALLQATPRVDEGFFDQLGALREWILSRVWPERYPDLRAALENFRFVADDFVNVFRRHSEASMDGSTLSTEPFYKIEEWNPQGYARLLRKFEFHVDLVHDLTCEMTRAANYVCDMVRGNLDRTFRIEQGVLLVRRGMDMNLMEYTRRLEYRDQERVTHPYPGLQRFLHVRTSRDYFVGTGSEPAGIAGLASETGSA